MLTLPTDAATRAEFTRQMARLPESVVAVLRVSLAGLDKSNRAGEGADLHRRQGAAQVLDELLTQHEAGRKAR